VRTPPWLWRRESDSLERLLLSPVTLASWIYGAGAWLHRAARTRGVLHRTRLDCCVVSVGSPVIGGAAKTPTAAFLAARLRARGHAVALATRGYGGRRARDVRILSDGEALIGDPAGIGDEALVLCSHAPGVPVLVSHDRAAAGRVAIAAFDTRVLVLDDGLAHHRLSRDVEIVTLDATAGLGNGRVLPRGPLREPLSGLARADAIGVVDGSLPTADAERLAARAPGAWRYAARRRPVSVRSIAGGPALPVATLEGLDVGLLSGIARPDGFARTVSALGARVVAHRDLADHHRYRAEDLDGLARRARTWITTEKDAVKILPSWVHGLDLRVLRIELAVEDEDAFVDWLEARIRASLDPAAQPLPASGLAAR
jgi:tetraacyldisaccharide 4'-kinase